MAFDCQSLTVTHGFFLRMASKSVVVVQHWLHLNCFSSTICCLPSWQCSGFWCSFTECYQLSAVGKLATLANRGRRYSFLLDAVEVLNARDTRVLKSSCSAWAPWDSGCSYSVSKRLCDPHIHVAYCVHSTQGFLWRSRPLAAVSCQYAELAVGCKFAAAAFVLQAHGAA
jgi:hypothetical protein